MPLITSNTDLKSLSFGHDRPGGASSGQPFLFTGFDIPKVNFSNPDLQNDRGIGQNVFDIPPKTFDTPWIGQRDYSPSSKTTLFNGNGLDIATPILNGLEGVASAVVNGAEGAINAVIGTINNSFDTTRSPSTPDFLWRKNRYNVAHSFADAVRITKFLTTPAGIFFIIKQELLERQSVKTEGVTRLYNPASTVVQAGVNSIGYHLNKSGINPFERGYAEGGRNGYYWNTKNSIGQLGVRNKVDDIGRGANRLTTLMLNKINRFPTGFDQFGVTGVGNRDVLLRYNGGPGAPLGIGFTRISLTDPTRQVELKEYKTIFPYNKDDIDQPDYLTPLFFNGKPSVEWYYNPIAPGRGNLYREFEKSFEFIPSSIWFGVPADRRVDLLNRNTKVITSSLYSHPEALENGTPIGKKGSDPSKPEYYTPNGDVSVKWVYTASIGVSSNYVKALEDANLKKIVNDNYDFLDPTSFKVGEVTTISKTDVFGDKSNENNNEFTLNGDQIIPLNSSGQKQNTGFESYGAYDFRAAAGLNSSKKGTTPIPVTNYATFNRDSTYQSSQTSYKGNFVPGYGRVLSPNVPISAESETPEVNSDIIDFNFTLHVPGTSPNRLIDFTAYIEDWSDGVKADWNPIKYMGRAESFYKYGGFSREASVTFLVPALSRRNLIANYKKLNALAWSVSPSYSGIGLMRGVITYFTMGDYFRKMPTIIKNIEFSQIEDMGWDINRKVGGGVFGRSETFYTGQLPKGIKVTVGFTPLHDYTPQVGSEYIGYSSDAPNIYVANPRGGQSAITSDSSLYANDRVPIPEPGSQIPPPTTFTPSSPLAQPNALPDPNAPNFRSDIIETPDYLFVNPVSEEDGPLGPMDSIPNQFNTTPPDPNYNGFDTGESGPMGPMDSIPLPVKSTSFKF
jgi:hypothetical protein